MLENPRTRYIGVEVQGDRGYLIDRKAGAPGRGIIEKTSVHPDGHPTLVELRDQARMLVRPKDGQADPSGTTEVVVLGFVNRDLIYKVRKARELREHPEKTSDSDQKARREALDYASGELLDHSRITF